MFSSPSMAPRPRLLRVVCGAIAIGVAGSAWARPAPSTHLSFGWRVGDHAEVTATFARPSPGDLDPKPEAEERWNLDVRPRAEGMEIRITDVEPGVAFPAELTLATVFIDRDGRLLPEQGTREARRLWTLLVERWIGTDWADDERRTGSAIGASPALGWRLVPTAAGDHFAGVDRCGEKRRPRCGTFDSELIPDPAEVRASFAALHAAHPEAGEGQLAIASADTLVYLITEVDTLRPREVGLWDALALTMVGGGGARSVSEAHYDFRWTPAP